MTGRQRPCFRPSIAALKSFRRAQRAGGSMQRQRFLECGERYMSNQTLINRYHYIGPVRLIPSNSSAQITYSGCVALCGSGTEYYTWPVIAGTLTTWIFPILGTLLQAPFESNAFWRTVKAINRWVGSPMSSMAAILFDIALADRCALFVDMAIPYESPIPEEESDFSSIRDSFYILMNLNQYKMKPVISMTKEAEGLLRIVLFSEDLELIGAKKTLSQLRAKLARDLRSNRRRGVVPIIVSTFWFLVALAISIEAAFGDLGSNLQAHNLAMGLFVAWFPVLVLCSIINRNPMAADDIQRKLNKIIDLVCISLQDRTTRHNFIMSFRDQPQFERMAYWVEKIAARTQYIQNDYFCGFSGQARTRFHYGAGYAILNDIETSYIADHERNWFADRKNARALLVLGQVDHGLTWFDGSLLWQILGSVLLVGGTGLGAFMLSYHTPTVGLGCRTLAFLIFFVVSFTLLIAEMLVWWLTSPLRKHEDFYAQLDDYTTRVATGTQRSSKRIGISGLANAKPRFKKMLNFMEMIIGRLARTCIRLLPLSSKRRRLSAAESLISNHFDVLHELSTRNWFQRIFFTPLEFANTAWLCFLLMAQTVGGFNNCLCMASMWSKYGGYVDFTQFNQADSPMVARYWVEGTVITCIAMSLGMAYITLEWLLQAHLCTENYADAVTGLKRVRRYRRFTQWIHYPSNVLFNMVNSLLYRCGTRKTKERKVLLWSK